MTEEKHEGLPVKGYRPQSETNVAKVNLNKIKEEDMLSILDSYKEDPEIDQRWLAIGRTQLEQAFMAINRAIFKPERIQL